MPAVRHMGARMGARLNNTIKKETPGSAPVQCMVSRREMGYDGTCSPASVLKRRDMDMNDGY